MAFIEDLPCFRWALVGDDVLMEPCTIAEDASEGWAAAGLPMKR